jgi:predicted RNA-binding protein with PIN domain
MPRKTDGAGLGDIMTHIVIDGYNYMMKIISPGVQNGSQGETLRRTVLERLARYKKKKGSRITVVFDAYNSMSPGRQRENYLGIDVVYSKENETADDVIIGWIREGRGNIAVVTSDRAIIDEAKKAGVAFMLPQRLDLMIMEEMTGKRDDFIEEDDQSSPKKGNPRKLPKKLRKAAHTMSKLK